MKTKLIKSDVSGAVMKDTGERAESGSRRKSKRGGARSGHVYSITKNINLRTHIFPIFLVKCDSEKEEPGPFEIKQILRSSPGRHRTS